MQPETMGLLVSAQDVQTKPIPKRQRPAFQPAAHPYMASDSNTIAAKGNCWLPRDIQGVAASKLRRSSIPLGYEMLSTSLVNAVPAVRVKAWDSAPGAGSQWEVKARAAHLELEVSGKSRPGQRTWSWKAAG